MLHNRQNNVSSWMYSPNSYKHSDMRCKGCLWFCCEFLWFLLIGFLHYWLILFLFILKVVSQWNWKEVFLCIQEIGSKCLILFLYCTIFSLLDQLQCTWYFPVSLFDSSYWHNHRTRACMFYINGHLHQIHCNIIFSFFSIEKLQHW